MRSHSSADASGQWLASGGDDGTARLWEVATGRCVRTWRPGGVPVRCVAWCPAAGLRVLAAAAGTPSPCCPPVRARPCLRMHVYVSLLCRDGHGSFLRRQVLLLQRQACRE